MPDLDRHLAACDPALVQGGRFIDGFARFFREPAETALRKYFIAGDTHLTERKSPAF